MKWYSYALYALACLFYLGFIVFERYALGFGWLPISIGMLVGVPLGVFLSTVFRGD